jgi:hypothetical protein
VVKRSFSGDAERVDTSWSRALRSVRHCLVKVAASMEKEAVGTDTIQSGNKLGNQ